MDDFTFKYMSHEPLPQLVFENVVSIGNSRIDGYPMYNIVYVGKLERLGQYHNHYFDKKYQRKLKLNKLLGLQHLDEFKDYEIAILEFIGSELHNIKMINKY